jgi:hypothetical protein
MFSAILSLAIFGMSAAGPLPAASAANLIADPGFESGTAGFTATGAGDTAVRTTNSPIAGTASLSVNLKALGGEVSWGQQMPAGTHASLYTVTAKIRPDTISQWTTLHLCAESVYSDELGTLQKCVPVPTVPGAVSELSVQMPLDPTKSVANVTVQVILRSQTGVVFEMDDVSAELTPATP